MDDQFDPNQPPVVKDGFNQQPGNETFNFFLFLAFMGVGGFFLFNWFASGEAPVATPFEDTYVETRQVNDVATIEQTDKGFAKMIPDLGPALMGDKGTNNAATLKGAQVLDMDGRVAGIVHDVLKDETGRHIVFTIDPILAAGQDQSFHVPYQDVSMQKNGQNFAVVLNEAQTRRLAEYLLGE